MCKYVISTLGPVAQLARNWLPYQQDLTFPTMQVSSLLGKRNELKERMEVGYGESGNGNPDTKPQLISFTFYSGTAP